MILSLDPTQENDPQRIRFVKHLQRYWEQIKVFMAKHGLPAPSALLGGGEIGYVWETTNPQVVLKVSGLRPPQAASEFRLFQHSHRHPHPGICRTDMVLSLEGIYLMWKQRLLPATDDLKPAIDLISAYNGLIKYVGNNHQTELNMMSNDEKQKIIHQAAEIIKNLCNDEAASEVGDFLNLLLQNKRIVQDLYPVNLGVNPDTSKLAILDGGLLTL